MLAFFWRILILKGLKACTNLEGKKKGEQRHVPLMVQHEICFSVQCTQFLRLASVFGLNRFHRENLVDLKCVVYET